MSLTQQQQDVVDYIAKAEPGSIIKVNAIAGSGKTHLLIAITTQIPNKNSLYICYNKSIAVESATKFPKSVSCKTTHSLAYGNTVKPLGLKVGFFSYKSITEKITYEHKLEVIEAVKEFCLSDYTDFETFAKDSSLTDFTTKLCEKY